MDFDRIKAINWRGEMQILLILESLSQELYSMEKWFY